jgi:hypothetical protein
MATQGKDRICAGLIQKITSAKPLDDADKAHLAACEDCMDQAVRALDEASLRSGTASGAASDANGHVSHDRLEAKQALENGRRVFEREFGIKLLKQ